jgi:NADP-dependent aldehyde dehydrogenase
VFGPYSLVVQCADMQEMLAVAKQVHGQLTATCMATEAEAAANTTLIQEIQQLCGRIIFNGVPTGVEVCLSMQHGGPFPASTDIRFGSVGADGIKRFSRPIAYQNWPDALLPEALQRNNPLQIWRTVNDQLTKAPA